MSKIAICPRCVQGNCADCTGTVVRHENAGRSNSLCACSHQHLEQRSTIAKLGSAVRLGPPVPSAVVAPEDDIAALRYELDACVEELAVRASLIEELCSTNDQLTARALKLEALPPSVYSAAPTTLEELQALLPGAHIEEAAEGEVVIYTGWRISVADDEGRLVPMDPGPVANEPPSPLLNDPDALPPKAGRLV